MYVPNKTDNAILSFNEKEMEIDMSKKKSALPKSIFSKYLKNFEETDAVIEPDL